MNQPRLPLLAAYGGGHANIIAAIAHKLIETGTSPTIIGFTTAYRTFLDQGLHSYNVSSLIEGREEAYDAAKALARPFCAHLQHPSIAENETLDYFAIGLRDLIAKVGKQEALAQIKDKGRVAFEPVATMEAYLEELRPSCIVTTTSPRFELALIRAGKRMGIATLAIADIFLQRERGWVLSGDYADHLCVLNSALRDELLEQGLEGRAQVYATGNPAFDALATLRKDQAKRERLRTQLGVSNKTLILWPSASVEKADFVDKPFANTSVIVAALDPLCAERDDYTYMIRPHPNAPHDLPATAQYGILDPGLSPEEAILASDVVCFEVSTMGLQAHLAGLPTICVGFPDIAVFPKYSNAAVAADVEEMVSLLRSVTPDGLTGYASLADAGQSATDKVVNLISQITDNTVPGKPE